MAHKTENQPKINENPNPLYQVGDRVVVKMPDHLGGEIRHGTVEEYDLVSLQFAPIYGLPGAKSDVTYTHSCNIKTDAGAFAFLVGEDIPARLTSEKGEPPAFLPDPIHLRRCYTPFDLVECIYLYLKYESAQLDRAKRARSDVLPTLTARRYSAGFSRRESS